MLLVQHLSYESPSPYRVDLGAADTVSVDIDISPQAVKLQPLDVTAHRANVFHELTVSGALHRRVALPLHGHQRVVMRGDIELDGTTRVSDVLRWFPHRSTECVIVIMDGRLVQTGNEEKFSLDSPANNMAVVEWYRTWADAPRSLRKWPQTYWTRGPAV